jgi:hypothetical protein
VEANNQSIQWCSQGLQASLDCWRNGYLWTYLYFDNSFLRENYYRRLPSIGLVTGILWYAHRTLSTIYATERPSYNCVHIHLLLLSLISKVWVPNRRKGYTIMLKKSSNPARGMAQWIGATILLLTRHWLAEPLDQTSNPVETEATKSLARNTGYTTYLSKCWWLQLSVNTR